MNLKSMRRKKTNRANPIIEAFYLLSSRAKTLNRTGFVGDFFI